MTALSSQRSSTRMGKLIGLAPIFEPTIPHTPKGSRRSGFEDFFSLASIGAMLQPWKRAAPLRILCVDGGGSKGIGVCRFLECLSEALGNKPLEEVYDFVVGTSIGGAILVSHFLWNVSMEEGGERLADSMAEFSGGVSKFRLLMTGSSQTADAHRQLCQNVAKDNAARPFTLEHTRGGLPMAVMVTELNARGAGRSQAITNYEVAKSDAWTGVEAVMATSCFPTVMPVFERSDGQQYRDGGLLANNPTVQALQLARRLWPTREIACVHSVGMGGQPTESMEPQFEAGTVSNTLDPFKHIVHSIGETGTADMHARFLISSFHKKAAFRRLELPLAEFPVFNSNRKAYDEAADQVEDFLTRNSLFKKMVNDLRAPADRASTSPEADRSLARAPADRASTSPEADRSLAHCKSCGRSRSKHAKSI